MAQGVLFGDYVLLGRLNRGGMAEVFLARGRGPGTGDRLFAVKRTLPELSRDRDFAAMFVDEASIARGLEHPNICRIYDQGEFNEQLFIVMEFVHGKDLKVVQHRAHERGEALSLHLCAYTVARVAGALDYAHKKTNAAGELEGVVHRDVSPQNILISYDGVPKLIDFGIAKAKNRVAKTQVGILKGKFAYMAPEQATGLPIDHRTDVFALGAVLYELVTGRNAFKGTSDYSTVQRVTESRYVPPQELNPRVPPELATVITRALALKAEDRYGTAAQMAADLDAYVEQGGRPVRPATLSAFMRRLFREDYIREAARIKTYLAASGGRATEAASGSGAAPSGVGDATAVAPSFINPERDSHDRGDSTGKREKPLATPRDAEAGVDGGELATLSGERGTGARSAPPGSTPADDGPSSAVARAGSNAGSWSGELSTEEIITPEIAPPPGTDEPVGQASRAASDGIELFDRDRPRELVPPRGATPPTAEWLQGDSLSEVAATPATGGGVALSPPERGHHHRAEDLAIGAAPPPPAVEGASLGGGTAPAGPSSPSRDGAAAAALDDDGAETPGEAPGAGYERPAAVTSLDTTSGDAGDGTDAPAGTATATGAATDAAPEVAPDEPVATARSDGRGPPPPPARRGAGGPSPGARRSSAPTGKEAARQAVRRQPLLSTTEILILLLAAALGAAVVAGAYYLAMQPNAEPGTATPAAASRHL